MKKLSKKYLKIHFHGKSDENGIFDVATSSSIFDKNMFSKNIFSVLLLK